MKLEKETTYGLCIGAVSIFGLLLVTEGVFGEGVLGAVAAAGAAGLSLLAGLAVYPLGKRALAKGLFANAMVFSLGAGLHVAAARGNAVIAGRRLELMVSAAEKYKAKYGKYPENPEALAPEFLAKVPRAKYTLLWGGFYIADGKIMYVSPMMFMTSGYDMAAGRRMCTGFPGLAAILGYKVSGEGHKYRR